MTCIFCGALKDELYRVIYANDLVYVLVNYEPVKDGHVMVLPVRHAEHLGDLKPKEAQAFLKAIDMCMKAITEAYDEAPLCLVNGWQHRSQPHLHAHVVPSKHDMGGLYVNAEGLDERKQADRETLQKMAEKLKGYFKENI